MEQPINEPDATREEGPAPPKEVARLRSTTSTIDIYIKLAQYPVLADQIRERMREEIFKRGVVIEEKFEEEVERLAIESQRREGLYDPFTQEPANIWSKRKARIRAIHTDFYFAYNLPHDLFEQIIQEVRGLQSTPQELYELAFNPELAPWRLLFRQGELYERRAPPEREKVHHHLEEIKVVLIKGMISDQLRYIGVAKKVFTIADLRQIYERRIGTGKIGGKAAGMSLAWKILQQRDPEFGPDISQQVEIPESYFLGTDVIYEFRRKNNMDHVMNQKYRPLEEIRADYPRIVDEHLQGSFPATIVEQIREVLQQLGKVPVIVRSSSLLEDNFGHSFAGKYESYFCPNQASDEENLRDLLDAIKRIYASSLKPDAILYRRQHGLIDYDERMAILIQKVRGHRHGRYFFPTVAGVGFSQNPFRWNRKIRREDGLLRLVWGLGTRAVERSADDYPRLVALSHPTLRPETTAGEMQRYSQRYVDLIDLEANRFGTLPVREVLDMNYPFLRQIAMVSRGDYLQELVSTGTLDEGDSLVITLDPLTRERKFVKLMRTALLRLERAYGTPVDLEFTVEIVPDYPYPDYKLHILQCRPLSHREEAGHVTIPADLPDEDLLFRTHELIRDGRIEGVRYVIFVDPRRYRRIGNQTIRLELGRAIGRLNKKLEDESFILVGPGRWGSANLDLGVRVTYADIYNTKALVEMAVAGEEGVPELSYGTHFFQDLVEDNIYAIPIHLDNPDSFFRWSFFSDSPSALATLSPEDAALDDYLRVIDIAAVDPARRLTILMDGAEDVAVGVLQAGALPEGDGGPGNV
ncbi:MAG: PEP/pyruvate-binding domain-containing protein [Anaerolineae bacterium]|nr:PEP/pyruvate-binding domain-containing protein [Anaerolineae bacterium]